MTKKNLNTIKNLIKVQGKEQSIDKIQEEAMELSLEMHQYKCPTKNKKKRLERVYLELADMKIQMRKAEMLFSKKKINRLVNKKLDEQRKKHGIK
jgi:predicted molibdopterin-dependent oxidoreductase YjgC